MYVKKVETDKELNQAFEVRKEVFVKEQQVPEDLELDAFDQTATHFVLYAEDQPSGAGRFRIKDGKGKVERVCVKKTLRGQHAGVLLMKEIEIHARESGVEALILNAQTHALGFYKKLGYQVISDEFMDAGIPHFTMQKEI
ncbi:GNAT family N-acetyltransferase [Jeotgalibacillus haloalkalitolerans]|uniref:GNAT family N-acetyltransferase n=1 Tax=Jeotgalibacillus haloalkalitolerans TaxID=3104292 RepID=A0ABU5KQK6_9BACL|nr:GNAT family N-acetyltransferase [Jeotgalibacillus sp. HH7-29]MDZ5712980.1 GNAT family N-acetyltransferase [Jeotgalibacillus sp. HH7-29]